MAIKKIEATKTRIRKGDTVVVIAGKDKGKTGVVTARVSEGARLIIAGINQVKKHVKPNPQLQREGGIITKEVPIHVSNVMILNPATNKRDRITFKTIEKDGNLKKVRCFVSNGEIIG